MRLRLADRRAERPVLKRTHAHQRGGEQEDLHQAHPRFFGPQTDDKRPGEERYAEHRPQARAPYVTRNAFQQEHRQRQNHKTKCSFHRLHPRAALRQQAVAENRDQNQRQAHAQCVKV